MQTGGRPFCNSHNAGLAWPVAKRRPLNAYTTK